MYAVLKVPVSLGADAAGDTGVTTIIEAIRALEDAAGQPVALFIIDTLARVMSGDNENEAHAISGLLAKVDKYEVPLALPHFSHPSPRKKRSSGDARLVLTIRGYGPRDPHRAREGCLRSIRVHRGKDGIEGPFETYTLDRVVLAVDEDGDEITSCVITPLTEIPRSRAVARGLPPAPAKRCSNSNTS